MNWFKDSFVSVGWGDRTPVQQERLLKICLWITIITVIVLGVIDLLSQTPINKGSYGVSFAAAILLLLLLQTTKNFRLVSQLLIVFAHVILIHAAIYLPNQPPRFFSLIFLPAILPTTFYFLGRKQAWIMITMVVLSMLFLITFSPIEVASNWQQLTLRDLTRLLLAYVLTGYMLDLTLTGQVYDRIRSNREMVEAYQTIYQNLPIGVYRSSVDGKQVRANRALYELNGYASEQEQLDGVNDIASEWYVDSKRRDEFAEILAQDGVVYGFESEIYRHKSRERIWITETARAVKGDNDKILYYEGTVQEISERKLAEKAERVSNERLTLITNNLPAFITYINADLEIEFINQTLVNALGKRANDMIGKNALSELASAERYDSVVERVERVLRGEQFTFEMRVDFPYSTFEDGFGIYVPHVVDGDVVGFITMVLDMTKERQAEEVIRQTQQLESLGLLAGGIAHDFNNLLAVIMGQISVAQLKQAADDPTTKHLHRAEKAAQRAADLCRQLLAYSGHGIFEADIVDVNQFISDNIHLFEVAMPPNVVLDCDLCADLPQIRADKIQIQQVFMNLLINASQAMEQAGEIHIRTAVRSLTNSDNNYWAHTMQPLAAGQYIAIEVQDNGQGMTEQTVRQIFDPFFTTKSNGHGLGLAAVLGIIRAHDGGLRLDTKVGDGTTFEIVFPAIAAVKSTTLAPVSKPTKAVTHHLVGLLIDDDASVRSSIRDMFENSGFTVVEAENGLVGIERFEEINQSVGIILLDLTMPGLSGVETLVRLRAIDPDVPVILTSGYHHLDVMAQLEGERPNAFIQKPYTAASLIELVKKHTR